MGEENERLRRLAQASLDARDKEAKAAMSLENAQTNFHRFDAEERAHKKAMIKASEADRALREALTTPSAALRGDSGLIAGVPLESTVMQHTEEA